MMCVLSHSHIFLLNLDPVPSTPNNSPFVKGDTGGFHFITWELKICETPGEFRAKLRLELKTNIERRTNAPKIVMNKIINQIEN